MEIIKQKRYTVLPLALIAAVIVIISGGLSSARAQSKPAVEVGYKKVKISELSTYDPLIDDKVFVPLPERRGLVVSLERIYTEPVLELVAGFGKWKIEFLLDSEIICDIEINVIENSRLVFRTPYKAKSGYDALRLTPLGARSPFLAYLRPIASEEDCVILGEIPERKYSAAFFNPGYKGSPHDVTGVIGYYVSDDDEKMNLQMTSISELDTVLLSVVNGKGRKIAEFPVNTVVPNALTDEDNWLLNYEADLIKPPRAYELNDLYLQYRYIDDTVEKTSKINPFTPFDDEAHFGTQIQTVDNLSEFDFVRYGENDTVYFEGERITVDRMLFVPPEKHLVLNQGQEIDLFNGASIVCRSAVYAYGTKEFPVGLFSPDGTGQGLIVLQANKASRDHSRAAAESDSSAEGIPDERSVLNHLIFDNLGEIHNGIYSLTGCVTFYESDVDFIDCSFLNNRSEDGLNIVRSEFSATDCTFFNAFQDAFDADFCTGVFDGCHFEKTGNDAFDVSTSDVRVVNCTFKDIHDKAVSIGEASTAYLENLDVVNAQACIGAKDNSVITAKNISGQNIFIGYVAYQKKPEFGHSETSIENLTLTGASDFDYLIEQGEVYLLDGVQKMPRSKKKEALIIEKIINEEPIG